MPTAHRLEPKAWPNVLADLPPLLRVASGDTVVTETLDAAGVDARGDHRRRPAQPDERPGLRRGRRAR